MSGIRISAPATAKSGEIIEIKTLIQHKMESGFRRGSRGEVLERDIINLFKCTYNGDIVFKANLFPSIAANPFITFFMKATQSGTLNFSWSDQDGKIWTETRTLTVE
jgi:sulfur-oxidizing protein SoxZ